MTNKILSFDALEYARLQLAAESFLTFDNGTTITAPSLIKERLMIGNRHASLFTEEDARAFLKHWEVVSQKSNTKTGFSATLFHKIGGDQYVISFRSTEFIDDYVRDNVATNRKEISSSGWAWGQLADMEEWYGSLTAEGGLLRGKSDVHVTGYSLGGHLATAFNLLHPGAAMKVVTFNGAGVGKIENSSNLGADLREILDLFSRRLKDVNLTAASFADPAKARVFKALAVELRSGDITPLEALATWQNSGLTRNADYELVVRSIVDIIELGQEMEYLGTVKSGVVDGPGPEKVLAKDIAALDLNYRVAVERAAERTNAGNIVGDTWRTFAGPGSGSPWRENQIEIVGDTSPSAVANSNFHHGTTVPMYVEDQPLFRGGAAARAAEQSWRSSAVRLLVDEYAIRDFGDTHSLVLLVDSIAMRRALVELTAVGEMLTAEDSVDDVLEAASHSAPEKGSLVNGDDQGKAEGDSLERVTNALGNMIGAGIAQLSGSLDGNTWWKPEEGMDGSGARYTGRNAFSKALASIEEHPNYQALKGKVALVPSRSGIDLNDARADFGAFLALSYLAPFSLQSVAAPSALDAVWSKAHPELFQQWKSDQQVAGWAESVSLLSYSNDWYADRSRMLQAEMARNLRNTENASMPGLRTPVQFQDVESGESFIAFGSPLSSVNERIVFGSGADDVWSLDKPGSVHAFGMDGDDRLSGGAASDLLEGNAGVDTLAGGLGDDTLRGGSGIDTLTGDAGRDTLDGGRDHDTLDGGTEDDQLKGGPGIDTLRGGDGLDTIEGGTEDDHIYGGAGPDVMSDAAGVDTYHLERADTASDSISDLDGLGAVYLDGDLLTGGDPLGSGKWKGKAGGDTVFYAWSPDASGRGPLIITSPTKTTVIQGFKSGDLGITLTTKPADLPNPPSPSTVIVGTAGNDIRSASPPAKPSVQGTSASERIQGLAGRDEVYGSGGDDIVDAGTGIDVASGDGGKDAVFADKEMDEPQLLAYITSSAKETAAAAKSSSSRLMLSAAAASSSRFKLSVATSEWLRGGLDNDTVVGASGDDILFGGGGTDLLVGGEGRDIINGDDDYEPANLTASSAEAEKGPGFEFNVYYDGVIGHDYARLVGAADEIHAGAGDDYAYGSLGEDDIWGDDGNDALAGGDGDDRVDGGKGDDRIAGDDYGQVVGSDEVTPHGDDVLDGGEGNDTLFGDGGADVIFGGAGDDIIRGNHDVTVANESINAKDDGKDYLAGGAGEDNIAGDSGNDTILGGAGRDFLYGDASATPLAFQGDDFLDGGDGNDFLYGNHGDDTLIGGADKDQLAGEEGDDLLDGGDLNPQNAKEVGDTAYGGEGNDHIVNAYYQEGNEGDDLLEVGFMLWGGDGADTLRDGRLMDGGAGNDIIEAWAQGSSMRGGAGNDVITGSEQADQLEGGEGADQLVGGGGADRFFGNEGDDVALGGAGDDQMQGGVGADELSGDAGNDFVLGQDGDDRLAGGAGKDYLIGGAGSDTFVVLAGDGDDVILDREGHDKVEFGEEIDADDLSFALGSDATGAGYLVIDMRGEDSLVVAAGSAGGVAEYHFADGTILTATQADTLARANPDAPRAIRFASAPSRLNGGTGNDAMASPLPGTELNGYEGNDTLTGSAGDETIYGGQGDDRIDGGGGRDEVDGGPGADTYVLGRNSGLLEIVDTHDLPKEIDTIELGAGIAPANVSLARDGDDLHVLISGSQARAKVKANFTGAVFAYNLNTMKHEWVPADTGIERIKFADGTVWDEAAIASRAPAGTPGTLTGTSADDTFIVDDRKDVVVEQANGGNDTIRASVSYALRPYVERLVLTGSADLDAWGSTTNATSYLYGNDGNNVFNGAGTVYAADGNTHINQGGETGSYSVMAGGKGNDVYYLDYAKGGTVVEQAGEGIDTIYSVRGGSYTLPANVENYRDRSSGLGRLPSMDVIVGNDLDNFISSVASNSYSSFLIDGGKGADTMQGGSSDDIYIVDNVGDRVVEPTPWIAGDTDTVRASVAYRLPEGVENLELVLTAPADGWGNELDNRLDGSGDTVASRLYGGKGNDTYVADGRDMAVENAAEGSDTLLFVHSAPRTFTAADRPYNVENMALGSDVGASNLTGDWTDETLTGNDASNVIEGGGGSDVLRGGKGIDTYLFSRGFGVDTIDDSAENKTMNIVRFDATIARADVYFEAGRLRVRGSDDKLQLGAVDLHFADGSIWKYADWLPVYEASHSMVPTQEADQLSGTSDADMIDGLGGNDFIHGLAGDDFVHGGTGNDTVWGDEGHDTLLGDEGADKLNGDAGNDRLYGLVDEDVLHGGEGDDLLFGGDGWDVLNGDDGDDQLDGGEGSDQLHGGAGNDVLESREVELAAGDTMYGEAGNDRLEGGIGPDQVMGGEGDDISRGGDGDDTLYDDEGGNDTLEGGAGDDRLIAGDGNDLLDGGVGADSLDGGAGVDRYVLRRGGGVDIVGEPLYLGELTIIEVQAGLAPSDVQFRLASGESGTYTSLAAKDGSAELQMHPSAASFPMEVRFADGTVWNQQALLDLLYRMDGTEGDDLLIGTIGNDRMYGRGGRDELQGDYGDDLLDGGTGIDRLVGGDGQDRYLVDDAADVIVEAAFAGIDTVEASVNYVLPANVDNLTLTGAARSGTGNALENVLIGTSGDDTLDGKAGKDTLTGGGGNDAYFVDNAADVVVENAGEGIDTVNSSVAYTLGNNVENLTLLGSAAIAGTGNALANVMIGNAGANMLTGGLGNDQLNGQGGADTLKGGAGDDLYTVDNTSDVVTESANEGTDTVQATATYTLSANVERLVLMGTAAINGTGSASNDTLIGNAAGNVLNGAAGADIMTGAAGNDTYVVDNAADVTTEAAGEGTDLVQASLSWTLGANLENLTLTGTGAINAMGNDVANVLTGNTGANVLDGKAGNDTLKGGAGNDTYVVDATGDVVTELASEGTDTVQSGIAHTLAANVENLTLTGSAAINGTGNTLANTLLGNVAANTLDGGAGADSLKGGAGDDTYVVDVATDAITENAGEGTDTVLSALTWTLGANLEKLTLSGTAAINGTGNTLNNVLTGNAAVNVLTGGAGADTMAGMGGNDTYVVDDAGDVVTEAAGAGTDLVNASIAYVLPVNVENLTLTGTAALNGTGNALANAITGNSGANVLDGGSGSDTLAGGAGNDIYIVDAAGDITTEAASAGTDTIQSTITWTLGAEIENLTLTGSAAINGTGNAGNNVLLGNAAANTLNGSAGADTMKGGAGNDIYVVDVAGDVVTELAGGGIDTLQSALNWTLGAEIENLTLTGTAAVNGTGNALANTLTGNAASNTLDGGAGADQLAGAAGDDLYLVDNAGDVVTENASAGTDSVQSSIAYVLPANVEFLSLTGAAAINGTGNALANWLRGNAAANTLAGGDGHDTLFGDSGNDALDGGVGNDLLQGGAGNDALADTSGNNVLDGGLGTDTLTGGAARDFFAGGAGADTITTGGGSDIVAFNKGDGADVINASVGTDDTLSLGGGFAYADLTLRKTGLDLILGGGAGDQITLKNWYQTGVNNKSILTLQVVADAMAAYNPASADPLVKNRVVRFNFGSLVSQFDAALAANPALPSWSLTNGLSGAYVGGSDTAALGGDFAYDFGHRNAFTGIGATPAQSVLASATFATAPQTLQAPATLYAGTVRMA